MNQETVVPYAIWKQKDGTEIRVIDMDDQHLFNTIRMLERNAEARAKRADKFQPLDFEEHFDNLPEHYLKPIYYIMVVAAQSRGIQL